VIFDKTIAGIDLQAKNQELKYFVFIFLNSKVKATQYQYLPFIEQNKSA